MIPTNKNYELKIMIVDDDPVSQTLIAHIIKEIPNARVAAKASSGTLALLKLKTIHIDLVLLDIEMPEIDGVETLRQIKLTWPNLDVIMISAAHGGDADKVITTLESGALEFIPKNIGGGRFREFRLRLLTIMGLVRSRRNHWKELTDPPIKKIQAPKIKVVGIAVSTGGPKALTKVIPRLPADLKAPVFIIQHMPAFITSSLASSLSRKAKIRIKIADHGEPIKPGVVYLARGGEHLLVTNNAKISLNTGPPENSVRPSADVLFRSLPEVYGRKILAVIMTGMGSDGCQGVQQMKAIHGCHCLSQTAASCTVYGMPKSVDQAGLSDEKVPLNLLGDRIVTLVNGD